MPEKLIENSVFYLYFFIYKECVSLFTNLIQFKFVHNAKLY